MELFHFLEEIMPLGCFRLFFLLTFHPLNENGIGESIFFTALNNEVVEKKIALWNDFFRKNRVTILTLFLLNSIK